MKPARFILNSDYTTVRNTGETTLSITIPNEIIVPTDVFEYTIGQTTANVGSATDTFMTFFTSSAFPYSVLGIWGGTKPNGASTTYTGTDEISFRMTINGNVASFEAWCNGNIYLPTTWTGYGQTITAHILTFKDPFSE